MSTHNLCFEQKYEKYQNVLSENFHFFVIKFSVYLNRHVFVMQWNRDPHFRDFVYSFFQRSTNIEFIELCSFVQN